MPFNARQDEKPQASQLSSGPVSGPDQRKDTPSDNVITPRFGAKYRSIPNKTSERVVLLQGPVGPFFKELAQELERSGRDCWRIVFNAGDRLYAGRDKTLAYTGPLADWAAWFEGFLAAAAPDHIVLFGSEREIHVVARRLAEARGIPVLCLEEGYIRPGFVTAEWQGNNRLSPIAGKLPPRGFKPEGTDADDYQGFRTMCVHGTTYYVCRTLFTGPSARSLFHRPISPLKDIWNWGRNFVRWATTSGKSLRAIQRLLEHHDGRYHVVPLQVSADSQIQHAAFGWTNARLIMETIKSFAQSAPRTHRLVFKIHPLERGHAEDHKLIASVAEMLEVSDRVHIVESGSLGLLTRHAATMITINSTSGFSAIFHGTPLLVIGDALYANPDLAVCARGNPDFDHFWSSDHVAPPALRQKYLAWVRHKSLKPGDFYHRGGREVAARAVREMIVDDKTTARPSRGDGALEAAV